MSPNTIIDINKITTTIHMVFVQPAYGTAGYIWLENCDDSLQIIAEAR